MAQVNFPGSTSQGWKNYLFLLNYNYKYNYKLKVSITITIIQVEVIDFKYNFNEKILKTLQPIHFHTKPRVLLRSTPWIVLYFYTRPIKVLFLSTLVLPSIFV